MHNQSLRSTDLVQKLHSTHEETEVRGGEESRSSSCCEWNCQHSSESSPRLCPASSVRRLTAHPWVPPLSDSASGRSHGEHRHPEQELDHHWPSLSLKPFSGGEAAGSLTSPRVSWTNHRPQAGPCTVPRYVFRTGTSEPGPLGQLGPQLGPATREAPLSLSVLHTTPPDALRVRFNCGPLAAQEALPCREGLRPQSCVASGSSPDTR